MNTQNLTHDVFLCHNGQDKPVVRELAEALRERGLSVWLDECELRPGMPWQDGLESALLQVRAVAVLRGAHGAGPWAIEEQRVALREAVGRGIPVIPVWLPGVEDTEALPPFLGQRTWVDLRGGLSEAGLGQLMWGITGQRPAPGKTTRSQRAGTGTGPSGQRETMQGRRDEYITTLTADDIELLLPGDQVGPALLSTAFVKLIETIPVFGPAVGILVACREKRASLARDNQFVQAITSMWVVVKRLDDQQRVLDATIKAQVAAEVNRQMIQSVPAASEDGGPNQVTCVVDPYLEQVMLLYLPFQEVPAHTIPAELIEAFGRTFDDEFSTRKVIAAAIAMRESMGDTANVLDVGHLPKVEQRGGIPYWDRAFELARKADSRMVAALLLAADSRTFSERAKHARMELLRRLTSDPLR